MIFYFSGTGNSYQAARALCVPGEKPLDMAACLREGRTRFAPDPAEAVGFVFPVYYGGLPSVVADFLKRLLLECPPRYCYAVLTCGSGSYAAPEMLKKALHARGIRLDAAFPVIMPDNYVLMFRIPPEAERRRMLAAAAERLEEIRAAVEGREPVGFHVTVQDRLLTAGMYPSYAHGRKTTKFFADERCVGCGVCAKRCPVGAITMVGGRPEWTADRCAQCMACLRCNAVQYGRRTKNRERYVNPVLEDCH